MQVADPRFPNIFAVGDVAATDAHKASGPGHRQAQVAADNIIGMIRGGRPEHIYLRETRRIHLSLGLQLYVTFENPREEGGEPSIKIIDFEDGEHDQDEAERTRLFECRVQNLWERRAPGVTDYYL
ncbi:FAD/NAD(P)-binding domain-containing protein [Mycena indigotica]|uniref:FAD/NAD(P)-binding domain-containing protein n=1 Tax=Mycena indigotica TaxID=2126181 RepID=A0A8H6T7Q1_9AGAR|nr:FAD/NAD(P)-binding domain-containing protein [Mycena indigotica]KAF7312593.1 FAD/NAD(P)-binding domain-containing protein [Mycena indigotica]